MRPVQWVARRGGLPHGSARILATVAAGSGFLPGLRLPSSGPRHRQAWQSHAQNRCEGRCEITNLFGFRAKADADFICASALATEGGRK
jgi:hypothetical protein